MEPTPKNNLDPGQEENSNPGVQLVKFQKDHTPLDVNNLENRLASLPELGVLYRVEFIVVDVRSTQFLSSDQKPLVDLWGPDAPRGCSYSSENLNKSQLIDYLKNKLPKRVGSKINHGIPVGIKIVAWQEKKGSDSEVELANTTIVKRV